jgi:hypothetical protein
MIEVTGEIIFQQEEDVLSIQELALDEFDSEYNSQINGGGWTDSGCTNRTPRCP